MKPSPIIAANSRPASVAYLIEAGDGEHIFLDAAFAEAFSRDGGRQTLVIPVQNCQITEAFKYWLKIYDPDIVFLATNSNEELIDVIEKWCSPLLVHAVKRDSKDRNFKFSQYYPLLSSLSWLPYLKVSSGAFRSRPESILDSYLAWTDDGLIVDNFGTLSRSFSQFPIHKELSELVTPKILTPSDAPQDRWRFGIKGDELLNAYDALPLLSGIGSTVTLAYLANMNFPRISIHSHPWTTTFCLVVGDSFEDRVACWNANLLFENAQSRPYRTLRVPASVVEDEHAIKQVREFINHTNSLNGPNGPPQVTVRSHSLTEGVLTAFAQKLGYEGWNEYHVEKITFLEECCPLLPKEERIFWRRGRPFKNDIEVPLRHEAESVSVSQPYHLRNSPPAHPFCSGGSWVMDISLDRTRDNGKYDNQRDIWIIPQIPKLASLFTDGLARITSAGSVAKLVGIHDRYVDMKEPEDDMFFETLLHGYAKYPQNDARYTEDFDAPYIYSRDSDKGRYLRGIITMFGSLRRAHEVLLHDFWRQQISRLGTTSEHEFPRIIGTLQKRFRPQSGTYTFTTQEQWQKLARTVVNLSYSLRSPKFLITLEALKKAWSTYLQEAIQANPQLEHSAKELLNEGDSDVAASLERLCSEGIFHQGYSWSCKHCAYKNWTAVESLKKILQCQVCNENHTIPADLSFSFRLNEFLASCLREHDTLSVLWALGEIQTRLRAKSFIYTPQLELFRDFPEYEKATPDRELDILCVVDGKVVIGEVKASLSEIDRTEIDNLISLARDLEPDIVVVAALDGDNVRLEAKLKVIKDSVDSRIEIMGMLCNKPEFIPYLP